MMSVPWLDELNPAQREAVTHGEGPLLVVAGAGTGKTKTLACRVAFLIDRGVPPDHILLLTFTRRAGSRKNHRTHTVSANGIGDRSQNQPGMAATTAAIYVAVPYLNEYLQQSLNALPYFIRSKAPVLVGITVILGIAVSLILYLRGSE